jgi:hypothetical protein
MSHNARASALPHAWSVIAERYLALLDEVAGGAADKDKARHSRAVG